MYICNSCNVCEDKTCCKTCECYNCESNLNFVELNKKIKELEDAILKLDTILSWSNMDYEIKLITNINELFKEIKELIGN